MELKEFTSYANSFQAIARQELESITLLMEYLGHPERDIDFVHVAGTNGKGSVCAYLQEIFSASGLKCGKYTSPNLVSVRERITIDGAEISDGELNKALGYVQSASDRVSEKLGGPPTQFEIWTAAAICYFKEKECDIVVLETGLGGERDATNVIPAPKASVIVRIDYDHTEYLGNTLSEIAMQKAGIIKSRPDKEEGLTITSPQEKEAMTVLEKVCAEKNNRLIKTGLPKVHTPSEMCEIFDYKDMERLKICMPGIHQAENACIAAETALALGIEEKAVREGLRKAKNKGRFEILEKNPTLLFDGAHNPSGMRSLILGLMRYFPGKIPVFIMGVMADKDVSGMLEEIKKGYSEAKFFTVSVKNNPRAMEENKLAEHVRRFGFSAEPCRDFAEAYDSVLKSSELTVICGSLYLYKDYIENIT